MDFLLQINEIVNSPIKDLLVSLGGNPIEITTPAPVVLDPQFGDLTVGDLNLGSSFGDLGSTAGDFGSSDFGSTTGDLGSTAGDLGSTAGDLGSSDFGSSDFGSSGLQLPGLGG